MNFTLQQLKDRYHYSPLAGVFEKRVGGKRSGYRWVLAGSVVDKSGYLSMSVFGRRCAAHRLAWFYMHGEWPEFGLDHKDGDRLNNAISNLRLATAAQNSHNSQTPSHNTSGIKGVSFNRADKKWTAQVAVARRPILMRRFKTREEAADAVRTARVMAHGEFANHGIHKYVEEEACNLVIK